MKISKRDWQKYITLLRKVNEAAADKVAKYMDKVDINTAEGMQALLDYSYAVATKYGEGATAVACQMYEEIAAASGKTAIIAEPAPTATYGEVVRAVKGKMFDTKDPRAVGSAVGRLVKMAGVDTTMKNAIRDGAEWAWIPSGDSCAFCLTLASQGWVKASKKVMKGNHADHIHPNCDCTFAIRFDDRMDVEGYDPEALLEEYENASDGSSVDKINALRRQQYAKNPEKYRAQKRTAYAKRKSEVNTRQIELWKKYGNKENVMLYGTREDLDEWARLEKSVGFDEKKIKDHIARNSAEWRDMIDNRVLGLDLAAKQLEEKLIEQWRLDLTKMSEDEKSALRFWTSGEYGRISEHFRLKNGSPEIKEKASLIKSALDKTKTRDTLYLRRGIGDRRLKAILGDVEDWEKNPQKAIGLNYSETSFIATTPFKNGAYGGRHRIYYKVPPGTKGTYIKKVSHADDELEFLMQLGTKGRIVNIEKSKPDRWGDVTYTLFVEILP